MAVATDVERAREAHTERAWGAAYDAYARADAAEPLGAADLELFATSAYMFGREDEYFGALERAHHAHLNAGEALRAAGCAIWQGMHLAQRGDMGRASGWLARARRLVEREGRECAEQGYLLLPLMFQQEAQGDHDAAIATAAEAAEIGERCGDLDLVALARHSQGHLLAEGGRPREGLELLDEAMLAVTTGETSPIVSGLVYCGVILGCQAAFELGRAREWTAALAEWCDEQREMVAFTGRCLVHRSELMQLGGDWDAALDEARRAVGRCLEGSNKRAAGEAAYVQGEVHRLRGDFDAARAAYRDANQHGREPQPGLALLRLGEGKEEAALAAIRRSLDETSAPPARARLLPAAVEIMLAAGEHDDARALVAELEEIASGYEGGVLGATAAHASGAIELAASAADAALPSLRRALTAWQDLDAPYDAARARVLVAQACSALGDADAAAMELEAARATFAQLGAAPDLARVVATGDVPERRDAQGLTGRELEVLRLVAAGKTNKEIAAELVISERTVDRHLSNIFAKLGVSSRTAATAFAYEHGLV